MNCGCCACLTDAGPHLAVRNRPGLTRIDGRTATYDSMLDAMQRRLTVSITGEENYSLHALKTRESDDPAIAFLDAWATVGDVLTFYQERILHEGYLRTAIERRSILELGRLVGYNLKPGVSASTHVAYTVEDTAVTVIPAGSQVQSIPAPGEKPEIFETTDDIEARGVWNILKPQLTKAQIFTNKTVPNVIWLAGANTRLEVGDVLLFVFDGNDRQLRRVKSVDVDHARDVVRVTLEEITFPAPPDIHIPEFADMSRAIPKSSKRSKKKSPSTPASDPSALPPQPSALEMAATPPSPKIETTTDFANVLDVPGAVAPIGSYAMSRSLGDALSSTSDAGPMLAGAFRPGLQTVLYDAIRNIRFEPSRLIDSVYVFRRRSNLFGYNAGPKVTIKDNEVTHDEWDLAADEFENMFWTDGSSEKTTKGSYVAVIAGRHPTQRIFVDRVRELETRGRAAYGISGRSTLIQLENNWWTMQSQTFAMDNVRTSVAYTDAEKLTLALEPITDAFGRDDRNPDDPVKLELDTMLDGFKPGRWIIVTGERADLSEITSVTYTELAMVAAVEHSIDEENGATRTILLLAAPGLNYTYKRDTVSIYGNVVKVNHGATRSEILGGGNAAKALQTFDLHNKPVTQLAAPTPAGVVSTLAVRVNDVLWYETDTFAGTGPTDRVFVTKTDNEGKTSVIFGTGRQGSRLPSGGDNVRAVYREGLGTGGNVKAGQIATAISRPLGVNKVINPLPATGGANAEKLEDARRNIPIALQALGRVVSVRDYADFARAFAGIAKASAVALSDGSARIVHITIGGADDIEIAEHSDLYQNLDAALRKYGDPYQPFRVEMREKIVMAGSARVRIHADYLWSSVQPKVQAALLDAFSFDKRSFGQAILPSEVVAVVHGVEGVTSVTLTALGGISSEQVFSDEQGGSDTWPGLPVIDRPRPIFTKLAHYDPDRETIVPAQIAYLPPSLSDLFILTEEPR
jgi:hypothetical protein